MRGSAHAMGRCHFRTLVLLAHGTHLTEQPSAHHRSCPGAGSPQPPPVTGWAPGKPAHFYLPARSECIICLLLPASPLDMAFLFLARLSAVPHALAGNLPPASLVIISHYKWGAPQLEFPFARRLWEASSNRRSYPWLPYPASLPSPCPASPAPSDSKHFMPEVDVSSAQLCQMQGFFKRVLPSKSARSFCFCSVS